MKLPSFQFSLRMLMIAAIVVLAYVFVAQTVEYRRLRKDAIDRAERINHQHYLDEKRP